MKRQLYCCKSYVAVSFILKISMSVEEKNMSRGKKQVKQKINMERSKTSKSPADMVGIFCDIRFYFLLSSAGRMDYGISEL